MSSSRWEVQPNTAKINLTFWRFLWSFLFNLDFQEKKRKLKDKIGYPPPLDNGPLQPPTRDLWRVDTLLNIGGGGVHLCSLPTFPSKKSHPKIRSPGVTRAWTVQVLITSSLINYSRLQSLWWWWGIFWMILKILWILTFSEIFEIIG